MMTQRPKDLPDFTDPPLNEIALAVQFDEMPTIRMIHYGKVHAQFENEYPVVEERERITHQNETFGGGAGGSLRLSLGGNIPPLRRMWMISDDGHQLLQFQPDRFVHNWRKVSGTGEYPRFESIMPKFIEEVDQLSHTLHESGLGPISPNQYEISYFNNITVRNGESYPEAFARFFSFDLPMRIQRDRRANSYELEHCSFSFSLQLLDLANNDPFGRLHVEATPGQDSEGASLICLSLIARGIPLHRADDEIEQFLVLGRENIVKTFAEITTPDAHLEWGRTDGVEDDKR